jgi:tRNA U38,U39,U40 pseudouridine synthase TruA
MTYMVRMIMGTILAYAQDKLTLAEIRAYLDNKVSERVSYKAPPEGLCLEKVIYEKATT